MPERDHAPESTPKDRNEEQPPAVAPPLGIGAAATIAQLIGNRAFTAAVGESDAHRDASTSASTSNGMRPADGTLRGELAAVLHPDSSSPRTSRLETATLSRDWLGPDEAETKQMAAEHALIKRAKSALMTQVIGQPRKVMAFLEGNEPNLKSAIRHSLPIYDGMAGIGVPDQFASAKSEIQTKLGLALTTMEATGKSLKDNVAGAKKSLENGKAKLEAIIGETAPPAPGSAATPPTLTPDQRGALQACVSQIDAVVGDLAEVRKKEQLETVLGFARDVEPAIMAVANGVTGDLAERIRGPGYNARNAVRILDASTRTKKENVRLASDNLLHADMDARSLWHALNARSEEIEDELTPAELGQTPAPATTTSP